MTMVARVLRFDYPNGDPVWQLHVDDEFIGSTPVPRKSELFDRIAMAINAYDEPEWARLGFRSAEQMAETMAEDELDRQRSRAGEGPWREE